MRRGGQEALGPGYRLSAEPLVRRSGGNPEAARIVSHFIAGEQPVEAEKGCVLHSLCHHGPRELLEAPPEVHPPGPLLRPTLPNIQQQHLDEKGYRLGSDVWVPPEGLGRGAANQPCVARHGLIPFEIRAVDRHRRQERRNRVLERAERVVAGKPPGLREPVQVQRQDADFARKRAPRHSPLCRKRDIVEPYLRAGEVLVDSVERLHRRRVDEETPGDREKIVAGCAFNGPGLRQQLLSSEDLLHPDPVPAGAIAVVDPSLAAQLGEGGGVTNPEPTTGGTTAEKPFFSQADYDQAVEQLRADLRSRLATVVPEARPGVIAYPGTAQQANDMVVLQEPGEVVGRVGPETTISGSLQANVLTVSREQLTEVALRMLAAAASPDSLVSGGEHVTLGEPVIESARASYRADADAVVYGLHASIADLREQVRSKTIAEAQRILGVHGTATITLSPDWLPALPDDPSRIEIAPEPPSPGATPVPMISPVPSHSPGAPASPSPVISPLPGASLAPGASDAVPTPLPSGAPTPPPSGAPTPPPSGTLTPRSSGAPGELASQEPAA